MKTIPAQFNFGHDAAGNPTMTFCAAEGGPAVFDVMEKPGLWLQFHHLRELAVDGVYAFHIGVDPEADPNRMDLTKLHFDMKPGQKAFEPQVSEAQETPQQEFSF